MLFTNKARVMAMEFSPVDVVSVRNGVKIITQTIQVRMYIRGFTYVVSYINTRL